MIGRSRRDSVIRILTLLAVFCIARVGLVGHLHAPTFGWRPSDLAGVAVNYYRNGLRFAYPQVMWGGAGAGHVEMEFPLQSFLTALFFKLFGLHDGLCVVLPLSFGFGLVWLVDEFGSYLFGSIAGFAGAVNLALSPTLVYITTTGMWPDPPMVFFGALGIYLLTRWLEGGKTWHLWSGVSCVSLAILCKLTGLYLGFPVAWIFVTRYGRGVFKQPTTWLAAALTLFPALLWYDHSYNLYLEDGNTFGIIGSGYLKFPTLKLLESPPVYEHALVRILFYHLTVLGSAACAFGLYRADKTRQTLLLVWFASVMVHTFVVWGGVQYGGHIGYLLPLLPVCNLLAGLGAQTFVDFLRQRAGVKWQPQVYGPLCVGLALLVAANTVLASRRLNRCDLAFETNLWEKKRLTGLKVAQITRPGALIIVVDHEMDTVDQKHSMTPPDVFYFGDRRGWYSSLAWLSVDKIEKWRARGARYFVVSGQSVNQFEAGHAGIYDYLNHHFRKVTDEDGIVYAL